jgi:hypothetical protein
MNRLRIASHSVRLETVRLASTDIDPPRFRLWYEAVIPAHKAGHQQRLVYCRGHDFIAQHQKVTEPRNGLGFLPSDLLK